MVEIWDELMAKVLSIGKSEGREMSKKRFVVLVQVVVVIDEFGKEGAMINIQLAKLQRKDKAHIKFVPNSIPGQDTTGVGVGHNVGIGVDSKICPVGPCG